MKHYFALLAVLLLCLAGCSQTETPPAQSQEPQPSVSAETAAPAQTTETTEAATVPETEETVDISEWDDVVELVNRKGDTATVYLLADGRYMDRQDRVFLFDGKETWMLGDEEWNRKAADAPALTWERAIDRFVAQRPDLEIFTDCDGDYAEKYVFWASEDIYDFKYQGLSMDVVPDGELSCISQNTMFAVKEIPANGGVVISLCIEGTLPNRGIQYTDGNGMIHSFYLTVSGENDNLLVLPYSCG